MSISSFNSYMTQFKYFIPAFSFLEQNYNSSDYDYTSLILAFIDILPKEVMGKDTEPNVLPVNEQNILDFLKSSEGVDFVIKHYDSGLSFRDFDFHNLHFGVMFEHVVDESIVDDPNEYLYNYIKKRQTIYVTLASNLIGYTNDMQLPADSIKSFQKSIKKKEKQVSKRRKALNLTIK